MHSPGHGDDGSRQTPQRLGVHPGSVSSSVARPVLGQSALVRVRVHPPCRGRPRQGGAGKFSAFLTIENIRRARREILKPIPIWASLSGSFSPEMVVQRRGFAAQKKSRLDAILVIHSFRECSPNSLRKSLHIYMQNNAQ
jgi:hypothetical protein